MEGYVFVKAVPGLEALDFLNAALCMSI